jgi:crotonobetainyl-CoA:carnitine CoA-transferase CaiB-like acyl-CoA transferase
MSALDDVVVIELTTERWSAVGAALLADFGAQVIRVEDLSSPSVDPDGDGQHPRESFDADAELVQRNKRSVGIDLSDPAGREVLEALVSRADVFLTDLPFPVLEQLGWSEADLAASHPGLIYAQGSGFGPNGPDRDLRALDELAAARTGVMPTLPQPGEPPVYAGSGQMYTAVMLAFGIMVALHHRAETAGDEAGGVAAGDGRRGEGQVVDASLFAGNLFGASLNIDAYLAMRDDRLSEPISRLDSGNPMSGAGLSYPTSDGRWVTLTMPDTERWWPGFAEVMGLDVDDPRFDTHDKRCGESRHEMMGVLEELFSTQTAAYWRQRFDEERLSADIIEKFEFVTDYEQASINRYVLDLEHPSYGRFQSLGFPIHMSDAPARLRRLAPCLGQHTAEVLGEVLGLADDEIADLEGRGVVGTVRAAPDGSTALGAAAAHVQVTPCGSASGPGRRHDEPSGRSGAVSGRAALEGIRVLDLTVWFQGPVCSQFLADFGAEVIHVERPDYGDPARGVRSINAVPVADWNQYFLVVNRNKKSIAVDLKSDEGRRLLHRLVAESDVFLWNQAMANLEPLGLDYQTLSAINPALVYVTNSGYGHKGSNKPAFDMTVQALTGMMTRLGEPGQPPIYLGLGSGDACGGLMSALGIMIALHQRRSTGTGQHVDASLLGSQLFMAAPALQRFLATGSRFYSDQHSRRDARNPLWNRYQSQDRWMFVCLENTDGDWARLCEALDRDDLPSDPRFADPESRQANRVAVVEALDATLEQHGVDEWMERFAAAGVTAAPINDYRDVADDEQAWANEYFTRSFCSEVGGEVELRGMPVTLSRTPGRVQTLGPELGQDTELLLVDVLGCSWDEIADLKAQGAIP